MGGDNGYLRLNTDDVYTRIIIQWGTYYGIVAGQVTDTIYFPITFTPRSIQVMTHGSSERKGWTIHPRVLSWNNTSFKVYGDRMKNWNWMAIGYQST